MEDLSNVSKETAYELGYTKGLSDAVVHGRWLSTDYFGPYKTPIYICSNCRKQVYDYYIEYHKFCLHCGAKMDLE